MSLIRDYEVPPGGWFYIEPNTGFRCEAGNFGELVRVARMHKRANGIEVPGDLAAVLIHQICERAGPDHCRWGHDGPVFRLDNRLGWNDVVRGTRTLLDWIVRGGRSYVEQHEADARAGICAGCYFNLPASGCPGCLDLRRAVGEVVGRPVAHQAKLHNCMVCSCSNRAQVWLPLDILREHMTSDMNARLPDFCWKKI